MFIPHVLHDAAAWSRIHIHKTGNEIDNALSRLMAKMDRMKEMT